MRRFQAVANDTLVLMAPWRRTRPSCQYESIVDTKVQSFCTASSDVIASAHPVQLGNRNEFTFRSIST